MIGRLFYALVDTAGAAAYGLGVWVRGERCPVCADRYRDVLGHCYTDHAYEPGFRRAPFITGSPVPFNDEETA